MSGIQPRFTEVPGDRSSPGCQGKIILTLDKPLRVSYQYQGPCPQSGQLLSLERSAAAEAQARLLMAELPELAEGKMFGVLLTAEGTVLKAYSGQWLESEGWAPAIYTPCPSPVPARLAELKSELISLGSHGAFAQLDQLRASWREQLEAFAGQRRLARERRALLRQAGGASELELESQREGTAWRNLKARSRAELAPLETTVHELESRIQSLKQQRRQLSASYQQELHQQLSLCLAAGQPWSLASLFPQGPPTGTGDCCAPKLLFQAGRLGLQPVAMAEFWWGPAGSGRQPGQFYAACAERCQPLIGPLLSRLQPLQILYEDDQLLALVKPPGVLTVPGRQGWNQDSLWLRLRLRYPSVLPVHRLDLETSGACLFALTPECQRDLQRQFGERRVSKCYEALLSRTPQSQRGVLDLAIGPDPENSGCYRTHSDGKASRTEFRQLEGPRYAFWPSTGRSHQIRVHAAQGLLCPIRGDALYGGGPGPLRLRARSLEFEHRGKVLRVEAPAAF